MSFDIASLSRTGGRKANEDYADFLQTSDTSCWVLADGLGGHRGGAVASKTVVEAALASFRDRPEVSVEAVHAHVAHAQAVLMTAQAQDPSLAQMRSTIVVLVSSDREAVWGHVGDSRLYHVRGGQIVERTRDHSVSQALVDGGQIDAHEQGAHEDRSRLLKCLGKDADTTATVSGPHALARGDAFLICTDGFWEALDDMAMELDFAGADDAAAWLDRLEARLRLHIGPTHDNYSATAVRVTSAAAPLALPHDPRRPIQAPWRQADDAQRAATDDRGGGRGAAGHDADGRDDALDAAAAVHAMGAVGRVLPASVSLRLARMSRPSPTTLAAAAVVMLALAATAVWQRHVIAAWVKAVITRNVHGNDQPQHPQSPQQPNGQQPSGQKSDPSKRDKPSSDKPGHSSPTPPATTPPGDDAPSAAGGRSGEGAAPPKSGEPSAAPPEGTTPPDPGPTGASANPPSSDVAPRDGDTSSRRTSRDATAAGVKRSGAVGSHAAKPSGAHAARPSGAETPPDSRGKKTRTGSDPSSKGAETPRTKP